MFIHITRHGQVISESVGEGRHSILQVYSGDPPLTDLGKVQATKLGRHLQSGGFRGLVVSSPYRRTLQTSQCILTQCNVRAEIDPDMQEIMKSREQIDFFKGASLPVIRELCTGIDAQIRWPWWIQTVEDAGDVNVRVNRAIRRCRAKDHDVLLVGHGATVNAATRLLLEEAEPGASKQWLDCWNSHLTTFEITGNRVRLVCLCDVSYLDPSEWTMNEMSREEAIALKNRK